MYVKRDKDSVHWRVLSHKKVTFGACPQEVSEVDPSPINT